MNEAVNPLIEMKMLFKEVGPPLISRLRAASIRVYPWSNIRLTASSLNSFEYYFLMVILTSSQDNYLLTGLVRSIGPHHMCYTPPLNSIRYFRYTNTFHDQIFSLRKDFCSALDRFFIRFFSLEDIAELKEEYGL